MGAGASAPTIAWEPSCLTPSAAELVRAIKTGEKRCVDVVTAALERIDLVEGNNLRATYDPVEGDDLPAKFAARDEGVAKLVGAYRAFFEARGIRALILPTFVGPPGRVDVEGYGGKALGNEYALLFHLNELRVPSLCLPIPSVAHGDTGIPASVLLYGVDDRELLGLALALEAALRA